MPQGLIIGAPISISQFTLYSAMFCPLHSNTSKKQHENISAIHPAVMENMENILVKRAPHISIFESHNASISAISNLFHNIASKA